MDLRKLRHAVGLARHLNFTKAAESLNLTQSALSRSIQALEEECQLRLFDRNRNVVSITATGKEFIRHAQIVLRKEAELESMVTHAARGDGGSVALGLAPLAVRTLLAPLMTEMIASPGFHATVSIGTQKKLLPMLLDESIHICVCTGQDSFSHPLFTSVLLARFPVAVVVRASHPLTKLSRVTSSDLDRYPLVRTSSFDQEDYDPGVEAVGLSKIPLLTIEDYDVLMKITSSSDVVWVTSPIAARDWLISGLLKQIPITSTPEASDAHMTAIYLKNRTMSPISKRVLDRLLVLSRTILQPISQEK